jgi:hypothetical protein
VYTKTCHICGEAFQSSAHNAKHCSRECRLEAKRRRRAASQGPAKSSNRTCLQCSLIFDTRTANKKYCSQECYRLATAARKRFERGTPQKRTPRKRSEEGFQGLCSVCGADEGLVSECPKCGYPSCIKCFDESGVCSICSGEPLVPVLVNAV